MSLGKDVFHALALIVWADGTVHESEAFALLGAAEACGLSAGEIAELRRVLEHRETLEAVTALDLGPEERTFVYAIAAWLTRVDGSVSSEEVVALSTLGDALGLGPEERRRAEFASSASASFEQGTDAQAHGVRMLVDEIRRFAAENRAT